METPRELLTNVVSDRTMHTWLCVEGGTAGRATLFGTETMMGPLIGLERETDDESHSWKGQSTHQPQMKMLNKRKVHQEVNGGSLSLSFTCLLHLSIIN